ncbi:hypothetical protein F6X53_06230 [Methylobacterium soli]|uniref:MFS transporter n=2 Tax=Methylobacterium soli TaxID=553447 RepID=A0A6L3T184_9HYPH|nr:MFS transporter [Methylobacterium soli]KAB1080295.1 hypothetical protein F6X53_06230 [Methylobacterium soli]
MAGLYTDQLKLGLDDVGWVFAIEQSGSIVGALLGFWLTPRVSWRPLIVGAAFLAAVANAFTANVDGFAALAALRFASGLGMMVATLVSACLLARSPNPDRAFGAGLTLNCLLNAVFVWLMAKLLAESGYAAAILSAAGLFGLILVLGLALSGDLRGDFEAPPATPESGAVRLAAARTGLAGLVLFGLAINMIWVFLERVGLSNGLQAGDLGNAFALGLLAGTAGSAIPFVVGDSGNRARMIAITTAGLVAGIALAWWATDYWTFVAAVAILASVWNMGLAYYMAMTAENDPTGRYTRAIYIAVVAAQAAGPAIAASLLEFSHIGTVFAISPLPAIFALLLVAAVAGAPRVEGSSLAR